MFNNYLWKLYLQVPGKEVVRVFENNLNKNYTVNYSDFICKLHKEFCPSNTINEDIKFQLDSVYEDLNSGINYFIPGNYSFKRAFNYIKITFLRENNNNYKA